MMILVIILQQVRFNFFKLFRCIIEINIEMTKSQRYQDPLAHRNLYSSIEVTDIDGNSKTYPYSSMTQGKTLSLFYCFRNAPSDASKSSESI